jgi:hypothetical protein
MTVPDSIYAPGYWAKSVERILNGILRVTTLPLLAVPACIALAAVTVVLLLCAAVIVGIVGVVLLALSHPNFLNAVQNALRVIPEHLTAYVYRSLLLQSVPWDRFGEFAGDLFALALLSSFCVGIILNFVRNKRLKHTRPGLTLLGYPDRVLVGNMEFAWSSLELRRDDFRAMTFLIAKAERSENQIWWAQSDDPAVVTVERFVKDRAGSAAVPSP